MSPQLHTCAVCSTAPPGPQEPRHSGQHPRPLLGHGLRSPHTPSERPRLWLEAGLQRRPDSAGQEESCPGQSLLLRTGPEIQPPQRGTCTRKPPGPRSCAGERRKPSAERQEWRWYRPGGKPVTTEVLMTCCPDVPVLPFWEIPSYPPHTLVFCFCLLSQFPWIPVPVIKWPLRYPSMYYQEMEKYCQ